MSETEEKPKHKTCVKCGCTLTHGIPIIVDGGYVGIVCGQTEPNNIADLIAQVLRRPHLGVCTTCAKEALQLVADAIEELDRSIEQNEGSSHAE